VTGDHFIEPWQEFGDVFRRAEHILGAFLRRLEGPGRPPVAFVPRCDIARTAREYVFRMAVPGVLEEDIDLTIAENVLTIRGEREDPFTPGGGELIHREFRDGYFERSFALPFPIQPDKVRFQLADGVLFLRIEFFEG